MPNASGSDRDHKTPDDDPPPDLRYVPSRPLIPRWLAVSAVAALWIFAWITQLDATREADRYGVWTITIVASLWLLRAFLRRP